MAGSTKIDRDIEDTLVAATRATPATGSTKHSAKAMATLALMGTDPRQWRLTPIEWVEEERSVPGLVTCPTCRGRKFVRIADGQVIPPPRLCLQIVSEG